ncbi:sensor histidine kinase [Nonomuraea sp. NN258]|uniref:sensor histidine kinase n=1 Tax=Nonomuraea antri TaxID=2730852 RepID=UPI0015681583|nr:sensor histidine kinase [Nonomuraea antri]NRQ35903.1 sensor histidine kinase [Nonomuraea antri]
MSRTLERKSAVAGLTCAFAAGVAVMLEMMISTFGGPTHAAWWWTAYLLYLAVLLVVCRYLPGPGRLPGHAPLLGLVVLGIAVFLLYPNQGWTAILFVVTVASTAFAWSQRAVVAVVAVQTAAVVAGVAASGWPAYDVVMAVVVYGSVQGFAALVVGAGRREAEARRETAIAHAELRAAATLLEAAGRDAERLRISRELHDVVGHQLTALILELEVASHLIDGDGDGDGAEHVTRARAIARDLLGDVRVTVGQMRSGRRPLEAVLHPLTRDVPGLEVSLDVSEAGPVEGEQAQVILRCVQEAITNTLRHAGAGRLDVVVRADADGIRVEARDDGRGGADLAPGNGLTGMRERFESLGGTLTFNSAPGAGFTVAGCLPAGRPA